MDQVVVKLAALLGFGLILGFKHALDADHVVAVSTIVSKTKSLKKSSIFGALWGAGHTTTLFLSGLIILILKITIPAKLAYFFEGCVGVVLVFMGLDVLRNLRKNNMHNHLHIHENVKHSHEHNHIDLHHHHKRSFLIGMLHGLAGSAALMLLVLTTVKSTFQGLLFILIFGIGSMAGMFITSAIIGLPFVLTSRFERINEAVKLLAGTISIILGITIVFEIWRII
ncbi:hypothetical protein A3C23_05000 [Candidatus Roizmanbacteria bacterium RIFCSPHIGHO2_02_FULL_37_13b]|uniref:Urease accessory protein UreH-like transmembrane domain-containing protein n=1 Tax=Candidatus Roizmanbacteria bacterium RIFCSPLOWO2_02_FULL_36_11 TaxID=1802071 RepID=A0A1F7JIK9_9BACT|nr:MAG: hypothetical protein A3C23_05000 [Candidatus Roizmanbacteria bacterium RIFCSPHIGHO2_02_FULL_37_13b]OGK55454.1 MAG: hypothetical protein A3H78_01185 [Candidatus Roizmanbacteria bacterium RIFCSPLOWO2_02_FULL_36_11]